MSNTSSTVQTSVLSYFGLEIGIFTLASIFSSFFVLKAIKGDIRNLESFFAKKSWKFLSNDKAFIRYTRLFTIITSILLVIPIISLIIWGAMVLHVSQTLLNSNTAGISILLIGGAMILIAIAVLYIKWSYSKIRPVTIICGGLGLASYLAFQLFALFDDGTPSFLGVSAVFLSINAMIMVAIGIMSYSDNKGSIVHILDMIKATNNKEDAIDTKYNELPIEEQYEKLLHDPEYEVTETEIKKYVTVANTREEFGKTILAGGLQSMFTKKSPLFKRIVLIVLYALSVGVLVAYAVLVKQKLPERYLGWITAIAVITTDIIVFFITQLKISSGQTTLSLLIVGMRSFLFGFGGYYWFLGYCSLYLLLSIVIGWKMVEKYLLLDIPLPKPKTANTKPIYKKVLNSPLFTYAIINIVFIIVVLVVSTVDSNEIPLNVFRVLGKDYPQWAFGIGSILISLTALALMITFRYHQRRLAGIKDRFKFPLVKKEFAAYLVFVIFTYAFAIICGALWYAIIDDLFVLLTALIIPPVILAIYVMYLNYKKNEYRILADIKALNEKTKSTMEGQAKALEQLKSMGTKTKSLNAAKDQKEDIDTVLLKDDQAVQEESPEPQIGSDLPEFLNVSAAKANKKLVIHGDWRAEKLNFFSAFYKRKLMSSDYRIIFSILFILCALLTYSIVIYEVGDEQNMKAWTVSVTLFVSVTIGLPLIGYFGALQTMNLSQIVLMILGVLGNYGYGLAATVEQFAFVEEDASAIATAIYWFFFLPMLICTIITVYDLKQKKYKRTALSTILGGTVFIHILGLGIFFALISIWAAAIVSWGVFIFMLGAVFVYYLYVKNNRSFSKRLVLIGCWGGFGLIVSVFIVSLCMDSFNDFVGFSLSYLVLLICYSVYAIKNFVSDILNASTNPVFYSPWIFPIYKYDPTINNLKNNNVQGYVSLSALLFLWLWSIAVVIWVRPVSLGISLGCLVEMIALVYFVYVTTDTTNSLSISLSREDLFQRVVKKAWLQARNSYLEHKAVTKIANLVNFTEHLGEAQVVKKYIATTKTALKKEGVQKVTPDPESLAKQNKAQNIKKLYEDLGVKLKSASHELRDEFRLLIHFELLIVLTITQTIRKEKVTLLSFINVRKAELKEKGLNFIFAPYGNMGIDAKYKLVIEKYESLNETQKKVFDELRDVYLEQVKQEKQDANELIKAQEEAKKERQKALGEKLQKNKTMNNQNMENVPIKDMPDSVMKYEKIAKEYSQGKKYEDPVFVANQNSVGSQLSQVTQKWDRPAGGLTLYGDGVKPDDPRQGNIGNCYFVSALSVAGKDNIEKAFLGDKVKQNPETGAFIVRFYFLGDPVDVIIDDLFPKDSQGNWSFCKSDAGDKLWPMILEKAYAKLHGGYDKIVAGKVSYALSELTGGYPEEMKMSVAQKNVDVFWNTIIKHHENGYLLGAGTPENPQGDRAISDEGIIQGHAYAILGLEEFNDERLIKLRNPHGSGGAEWRGDWGDNSFKWNEKAKKQLKFENKEDGIFWMSLDDFVYEFKSLYVCRIFDQKLWKTVPTIEGEWKGESAAGLPNKNNPGANLSKNPHYGIKVPRRCSVFVSLTQVERIDMFRGKFPIMFMVQKNDGKRVKSASLDLLSGSSGAPTDLITVSAEISLEAPTYPYTFSLMVATANAGAEGKYELNIQCTDDFSIVDLK